jgi:hypothetical protein
MAVSGRYRLTGVDGIQFEFRHGEHETEVDLSRRSIGSALPPHSLTSPR